jgi:hypothetical protein
VQDFHIQTGSFRASTPTLKISIHTETIIVFGNRSAPLPTPVVKIAALKVPIFDEPITRLANLVNGHRWKVNRDFPNLPVFKLSVSKRTKYRIQMLVQRLSVWEKQLEVNAVLIRRRIRLQASEFVQRVLIEILNFVVPT